MAGETRVIILVLVLCLGINLDKAEASHYDACRRALLHSDFRSPCGSLSASHKRPCLVSTAADKQYLKDVKIRHFYRAPGTTQPMICAPRWNNTKNAECVSAPLEADDSVGWTWSKWSAFSGGTTSRRVTLTGYDTDVPCIHAEIVLKDCTVAMDAGLPSGVTTINPDGTTAMEVYCDQDTDGGGWIVFQKRISDSNFYLKWVNYTAGFGDPGTNYWLGLENIHLLTSMSYTELKIVVEYPAGTFAEADYSSFVVQDSSTDFTLQVSGYSSTSTPPAGDALTYHHGRKFSTRDRDNDVANKHCAQVFKGAWWYKGCHHSNLNGIYRVSTFATGMVWKPRSTYSHSLVSSKMMVR